MPDMLIAIPLAVLATALFFTVGVIAAHRLFRRQTVVVNFAFIGSIIAWSLIPPHWQWIATAAVTLLAGAVIGNGRADEASLNKGHLCKFRLLVLLPAAVTLWFSLVTFIVHFTGMTGSPAAGWCLAILASAFGALSEALILARERELPHKNGV